MKSIFSGLYCCSFDTNQANLIMKENEKELFSSIDYKRIQKKSSHADLKILKSKIKETKKAKILDSLKVGLNSDYSDFANLMKNISKIPKPSEKLRILLFNEGPDQ